HWYDLGDVQSIPEGRLHSVRCAGRDWVIVKHGEELRCFLDRCSHQDIKLSEFGHLDGGTILCFAHGARFCDRTGVALCWPAEDPLTLASVRVESGRVLLLPPADDEESQT
ncbi:MAG: Rieske (2Fe-2S) protein, partial [Oligoflexus sp.]